MIINPNGTIGQAVALYTNCDVLSLDIVQDPVVADVVAIKAEVRPQTGFPGVPLFFLVRGVPLQKIRAADLEEVEFTAWPPTARL